MAHQVMTIIRAAQENVTASVAAELERVIDILRSTDNDFFAPAHINGNVVTEDKMTHDLVSGMMTQVIRIAAGGTVECTERAHRPMLMYVQSI